MFYGSTNKTEKLLNALSVITICFAKLHVCRRPKAREYFFVSMQNRTLYMKTWYTVAGDTDFPYKHCYATLSMFQ